MNASSLATYTNGNGNGHSAPAPLFPPARPAVEDTPAAPMPVDRNAERAFLGSALIDPDIASRIESLIDPADFFYAKHKLLAQALARLATDNRPADLITILDEVRVMGQADEILPTDISDLFNATPSSVDASHYASIVKMHAYNRRAIAIAGKIAEKAYSSPRAEELHGFIQEQLHSLTAPASDHSAIVPWAESHRRYLDILEKREEQAKAGPHPARWHWKAMNQILAPIEPGFVVQIAADTGGFKTVFMECITESWARNGLRIAIFHCELPETLVMDRRMARWGSIPRSRLKDGKLTADEWQTVMEVSGKLHEWPGSIDYVYSPDWDIDRIAREMEYLRHEKGVDTFVIDHMKNLSVAPRQMQLRMSLLERQSDNVRKAKAAAGYCNANLLLLNQMTKSSRDSSSVDLMTKDGIGGSGEQVDLVNAVILLHRGTAELPEADPATGEVVTQPGERSRLLSVKVAKNTGGPAPATFKLWIEPQFFRLKDVRIESHSFND